MATRHNLGATSFAHKANQLLAPWWRRMEEEDGLGHGGGLRGDELRRFGEVLASVYSSLKARVVDVGRSSIGITSAEWVSPDVDSLSNVRRATAGLLGATARGGRSRPLRHAASRTPIHPYIPQAPQPRSQLTNDDASPRACCYNARLTTTPLATPPGWLQSARVRQRA
jgi:hypothetical protein